MKPIPIKKSNCHEATMRKIYPNMKMKFIKAVTLFFEIFFHSKIRGKWAERGGRVARKNLSIVNVW